MTNRTAAARFGATSTAPFFASERHAGFDIVSTRELPFDLSSDAATETQRGGDEKRDSIRIVFGLGDQIGCDEARIAARREDYCFGWSGEQINRAVGADQALRSGDVAIARAKYFVHARN